MKCKLSIQEKLKDLRIEKGLSLQELSEQTGISRASLGNYETDDYKEISHKAIRDAHGKDAETGDATTPVDDILDSFEELKNSRQCYASLDGHVQ